MADTSEETPRSDADGGEPPRPAEPGAPRGDELDPELISLKSTRRVVGPLLSLSVIVFCVFILIRLAPDFHFSRQSSQPRRIDDLAKVLHEDGVAPNDYITVRAVPDYSFVFRVAKGEADYGYRAAPVVGTNGKLWLLVVATTWTLAPDYSENYTGRLREISSLPFYDRLRTDVAARPPAPRVVATAAIRKALETGASQVVDPYGDQIAIAPTTPITISETVLDRARIEAFKYESYPDEATWRAALIAAGVLPADATPQRDDDEMAVYEVPAPDGLAAIRSKLIAAKLFRARAKAVTRHHQGNWSGLAAGADGLTVDGTLVPWPNISSVAVIVPRTLDPDALVLMTAERPGTYWYILPVYIVLALFILLFAWALVRFWRSERSTPASGVTAPPTEDPSN